MEPRQMLAPRGKAGAKRTTYLVRVGVGVRVRVGVRIAVIGLGEGGGKEDHVPS